MRNTTKPDHERFGALTYDDFKQMALDSNLSRYEKIGFPDAYRAEKESFIFSDILSKLPLLEEPGQIVLDIGPGCSDLPHKLIDLCEAKNHQLILIDSQEMLDLLPDAPFIKKIPGLFPQACKKFILDNLNSVNVILCYSVLHYIFSSINIYEFLDDTLNLLTSGGQILLGDIPNISKRKRFLSSEQGLLHHKQFYDADNPPKIEHFIVEKDCMDDAVINGLILRSRAAGFDAYWMPQPVTLPMANRREDIVILKP